MYLHGYYKKDEQKLQDGQHDREKSSDEFGTLYQITSTCNNTAWLRTQKRISNLRYSPDKNHVICMVQLVRLKNETEARDFDLEMRNETLGSARGVNSSREWMRNIFENIHSPRCVVGPQCQVVGSLEDKIFNLGLDHRKAAKYRIGPCPVEELTWKIFEDRQCA